MFVFFWGGAVCLFLPLRSLSRHWSMNGLVNWLAVRVAGGHGPCPAFRAPCALCTPMGWWPVLLGPGLGSAGWAVAPAGFVGSWVKGGGRCMGRFFGVPSVPPPLWRRLGAGGFNFPVWFVLAGRCGWGAGFVSGFSWRFPVSGKTGCCCSLELTQQSCSSTPDVSVGGSYRRAYGGF